MKVSQMDDNIDSFKSQYDSDKALIRTNLATMGVSSQSSDSLTTLANKILDIDTGGADTIVLITNKSILSYYDSETATLTATYSKGAGYSLEVYNAVTGTKIGDMTDNNDGTYTYTYSSAGTGDISMTATAGTTESNSILIEDCTYYNPTQYSTSNQTLNVPLPTHFTLEYLIKQTNTNASVPYLDIGDSSNNRILVGQYARAGTNGIIIYGSSTTNHPYSSNPIVNQENSIYFKYDGTKYYYALNDGAIMEIADANVTLTKLIHVEGGDGGYLKNIKIKAIS